MVCHRSAVDYERGLRKDDLQTEHNEVHSSNAGASTMNPIHTPRLTLREFTIEDAQPMWELQRDPRMSQYTADGGVQTAEEIERILREVVCEDYRRFGFGRWAVIHREHDQLIGFSGLKFLSERDEVDIGYRFGPEYWGQGLATEAGLAVMDFGWNVLQLSRIVGMVLAENTASVRVLEKLGLEFQGQEQEYGETVDVYAAEHPLG